MHERKYPELSLLSLAVLSFTYTSSVFFLYGANSDTEGNLELGGGPVAHIVICVCLNFVSGIAEPQEPID